MSSTDPTPPAGVPVADAPGAPTEVLLPMLDVRADVTAIRSTGDTLVPPADPALVGWWSTGSRPGARRGTALLTGHTVSSGGGALGDLEQVQPGDRLEVRAGRRSLPYEVLTVEVFTKGELATKAARLFDQRGPHRLALVTCEDWDGSRFRSNVVVIAVPATQAHDGTE